MDCHIERCDRLARSGGRMKQIALALALIALASGTGAIARDRLGVVRQSIGVRTVDEGRRAGDVQRGQHRFQQARMVLAGRRSGCRAPSWRHAAPRRLGRRRRRRSGCWCGSSRPAPARAPGHRVARPSAGAPVPRWRARAVPCRPRRCGRRRQRRRNRRTWRRPGAGRNRYSRPHRPRCARWRRSRSAIDSACGRADSRPARAQNRRRPHAAASTPACRRSAGNACGRRTVRSTGLRTGRETKAWRAAAHSARPAGRPRPPRETRRFLPACPGTSAHRRTRFPAGP